jgi:NADPH:quinone reductase-like Zn-dependent oxidoreductase
MRAVAYSSYGGPEVLQVTDLPAPKVGPDTVLVRVRAAGVNPVDIKIREGLLDPAFFVHFPVVPGWDVAGVVEQVGPAVPEFAVGDEVLGYVRRDEIQHGTAAELVPAPVRALAKVPAGLPLEQAGAIPLAGLTAWQALDAAAVRAGDTVLVHAAAGGVGSFAVQLAALRGATVVGTASPGNHDYLRGLGATPVEYGAGLAERVRQAAPGGVDAALDLVGGDAVAASFDVVGDAGRVVSIVDAEAVVGGGGRYVFVRPNSDQLAELARLAASGDLVVPVEATYPLQRVREAHERVQAGHGRGKVVLTV